jgi:hypothetical protein
LFDLLRAEPLRFHAGLQNVIKTEAAIHFLPHSTPREDLLVGLAKLQAHVAALPEPRCLCPSSPRFTIIDNVLSRRLSIGLNAAPLRVPQGRWPAEPQTKGLAALTASAAPAGDAAADPVRAAHR